MGAVDIKNKTKCKKNQSGQGTLEYVVFLFVLVVAVIGVARSFQGRIRGVFDRKVRGALTEQFASSERMHRYRPPGGFR